MNLSRILHHCDCLEVLRTMPESSVDAVVIATESAVSPFAR